jgi:hypothetical protein
MASTQVSSRPNPLSWGEIPFSCNGKLSDVLRQTEEFAAGSYVKLTTCEVPYGWTNHPAYLGVNVYFTGKTDNIKATLKADYNIPDARPIITDRYTVLLDGGDGKYYLWNDISGIVARIEELDLEKILAKLGSEGLSGIKCTILTE